jgi:hypothetical protein
VSLNKLFGDELISVTVKVGFYNEPELMLQASNYDLIYYMNKKTDLCPLTKFVLTAFSQGTQLTSRYLAES